MKKNDFKFATCLAVHILFVNASYSQTVNTYNFNFDDSSIGNFKLLTTEVLDNTVDFSKDSVVLIDATKLATVSFFAVSNRLSKEETAKIDNYRFNVFPNPFTKSFEVNFESNTNESGKIKVFDALGRKIISENRLFHTGSNQHFVDLSSYKAGIYFVSISIGQYQETRRVIKE